MVNILDPRLNVVLAHDAGDMGFGRKVAIWECNRDGHHDCVKAEILANAPLVEIKSWYWEDANSGLNIMSEITKWGADFCNMSFEGWNPDVYAEYKDLAVNRDSYEIADTFFKSVVCVAAIGNGYGPGKVFPSATEAWDTYVMGVGSYKENVDGTYGIATHTSINAKLDYLSIGTVTYNGKSWTGTSMSAPTITGMLACLSSQYERILGHKPIGHKPYYAMLDVISVKATHEGKVYKVPVMELFKGHEINFKLNSNKFSVDDEEFEMLGLKGGHVDGAIVPVEMIAIDGRTMIQTRYIADAMRRCLPIVAMSEADEWWDSGRINIKIMSTR